MTRDRMRHWWNTELNYEGRGTQREIGLAYRARNGESFADMADEFKHSNQYAESKYVPGNNNDVGEEFHPVAVAEEAAIIAAGGV